VGRFGAGKVTGQHRGPRDSKYLIPLWAAFLMWIAGMTLIILIFVLRVF
jgi:hypothetical protein